jgi:hypothetical protein
MLASSYTYPCPHLFDVELVFAIAMNVSEPDGLKMGLVFAVITATVSLLLQRAVPNRKNLFHYSLKPDLLFII